MSELKAQLAAIAKQPAVKCRIGQVPVHGSRLRDLLRAVPEDFEAELSPDGTRIAIRWNTATRRGQLSLRVIARPSLSPAAREALAYAQDIVKRQARGYNAGWRVRDLPKEMWAAVRPVFGEKKYANQSAEDAVRMLIEYGWRDF